MNCKSDKTTRRNFFKIAGAGVTLAAIPEAVLETHARAEIASPDLVTVKVAGSQTNRAGKLVELVNPLQGTNSSPLFSRGNTLPIVALPFGMAHWTLQSNAARQPWFFRPEDNRIEGLRCTHQLSPWLSDYGFATFLPFTGSPSADPAARASSYRTSELKVKPHLLDVTLMRYGCNAQLVPTERCGLLRLTFNETGPSGLMIDLPGEDAEFHAETGSGVVSGLTRANAGGVPKGFATYYAVQLGTNIKGFEVKAEHGRRVGVLQFDVTSGRPVDLRIAHSFISHEQAMRNLKVELGNRPFEQVRDSAEDIWEKRLGLIQVEGGSEAQQRTFYSALYRTSLFPRMWHEPDASGQPIHMSPYSGQVIPGVMYADHGYWDVYRAWYPLMSIIDPERLGEILQAWVNAAKEGGWLPQFPCPGYRACMTGSLIDSVFGDAAVKGISGYDPQAAYAALKKHATQPGDPDAGYGRRGIEFYLQLGYVPSDRVDQAAVETLDAAYGDFCIAQVARAAGNVADAEMFEARSRNWRKVFDSKSRFMRGRKSDGTWDEPFNQFAWGSPYVEGSAWQHRFSVPHDPDGLIEAMGGREDFVGFLDEMLQQPPRFEAGAYGREIHEMSEMAAVDFGQYAHSNQPVHHVLYMFAAAGRADRTQYWVRRVMNGLYTRDNFPGDEDTGSMAAWYVLSALGFYPLCPGKPSYVLGGPLFSHVTLHLPGGKRTTIEAVNNSPENIYCANPTIDSKTPIDGSISHEAIARGSELVFTMSAKATR